MTDEEMLEEQFFEALGLGPVGMKRYRKDGKTETKRYRDWRKKAHEKKMDYYVRQYRKKPVEERRALQHRGTAHDIVTKRIGRMMRERKESNKGHYATTKHVFVRRDRDVKRGAVSFDTFFSEFQSRTRREPIQAKVGQEIRTETWGSRIVSVLRGEDGRFERWQRKDRA